MMTSIYLNKTFGPIYARIKDGVYDFMLGSPECTTFCVSRFDKDKRAPVLRTKSAIFGSQA